MKSSFLAACGVLLFGLGMFFFGYGYHTRRDEQSLKDDTQLPAQPAPKPPPAPAPAPAASNVKLDGSPVDNRGTADAVAPPEKRTITVSFMPGQAESIPNRKFRKIEVHSEYPIRAISGRCHSDYTVEFICENPEPTDLFIVDTRHRPLFVTPRANQITFNLIQY